MHRTGYYNFDTVTKHLCNPRANHIRPQMRPSYRRASAIKLETLEILESTTPIRCTKCRSQGPAGSCVLNVYLLSPAHGSFSGCAAVHIDQLAMACHCRALELSGNQGTLRHLRKQRRQVVLVFPIPARISSHCLEGSAINTESHESLFTDATKGRPAEPPGSFNLKKPLKSLKHLDFNLVGWFSGQPWQP